MTKGSLMKQGRELNRKYLDWIRTQPCIIHPQEGVESEPHHFTKKGHGGFSTKCPDTRAIPLRFDMHREIHQVGRWSFLKRHNITEEFIEENIERLNKLWEER